MSHRSRRLSIAAHLTAAALVLACAPTQAAAGFKDCSQPVTSGAKPTASDCLFILRVAVGSASCDPECICAPKGSLPATATDALVCLRVAVGQPQELDCPCEPATTTTTIVTPTTTTTSTTVIPSTTVPPSTSTTTTSTTSTTIVVVTTSTTTTTTIDPCAIESAICTQNACSCGQDPGIDYHIANSSGSVTGAVGAYFTVNISVAAGGVIDCGGWTRIGSSAVGGCDNIGCCRREGAQPETANWSVFEVIDLPCNCPSNPEAPNLKHNLLLQCIFPGGSFEEHEQTSSGCS